MEEWCRLDGYMYDYYVSNKGRVRKGNRILSLQKHHRGHLRVSLRLPDGGYKLERVHRLVALAFIDNPNNYPLVNHIDGDMENNSVENLEWCDASHNVLEGNRLRQNKRAASYPLKAINVETKEEFFFQRMRDAEEFVRTTICEVQTPRVPIRDCCLGKLRTAYGHVWSYITE